VINDNNIEIDGIGLVHFTRSRRARRIIISVSPAKGVRVAIPSRSSLQKALEFVQVKKRWIQKHLALIAQIDRRKQASGVHLQTIDTAAAKNKIIARLQHLAGEYGFKYHRVTVRNQKTRWGSCSPANNISLNIKLVLLPDALLDYVILHELVHTRMHNHSKKFWTELDRYVKDSKSMAKRLRTDGMLLL
jgi:predicted metal-dependent hydrolase